MQNIFFENKYIKTHFVAFTANDSITAWGCSFIPSVCYLKIEKNFVDFSIFNDFL